MKSEEFFAFVFVVIVCFLLLYIPYLLLSHLYRSIYNWWNALPVIKGKSYEQRNADGDTWPTTFQKQSQLIQQKSVKTTSTVVRFSPPSTIDSARASKLQQILLNLVQSSADSAMHEMENIKNNKSDNNENVFQGYFVDVLRKQLAQFASSGLVLSHFIVSSHQSEPDVILHQLQIHDTPKKQNNNNERSKSSSSYSPINVIIELKYFNKPSAWLARNPNETVYDKDRNFNNALHQQEVANFSPNQLVWSYCKSRVENGRTLERWYVAPNQFQARKLSSTDDNQGRYTEYPNTTSSTTMWSARSIDGLVDSAVKQARFYSLVHDPRSTGGDNNSGVDYAASACCWVMGVVGYFDCHGQRQARVKIADL